MFAHGCLYSLLVSGVEVDAEEFEFVVAGDVALVAEVLRSVGKVGAGIVVVDTCSRSGNAGRMLGPRSVSSTRYVSFRSPTTQEYDSSVNAVRLVAVGSVGEMVLLVKRSSRRFVSR